MRLAACCISIPRNLPNRILFKANVSEKRLLEYFGKQHFCGIENFDRKLENSSFAEVMTRIQTIKIASPVRSSTSGPNENRVTNTRYNETDLKAGIGYSNNLVNTVLRYNFNRLDVGIPENGIAEQTESKKTALPRQGVFNNLLSLNTVFSFQKSKLDVDLGYIDNDRSEFENSSIAALHLKLRTLNYDAKFHFPKLGNIETIVGIQGMHQTNANSGEEYLIPDAATNDLGVFGTASYEWKTNSIEAGLRFDNRNISSESHGTIGEEGSFLAIDKSFNSFNASLGYKTNLAQKLTLRLNVASGFRAPNLAELTSNGVHEGTNRYEIGNNES